MRRSQRRSCFVAVAFALFSLVRVAEADDLDQFLRVYRASYKDCGVVAVGDKGRPVVASCVQREFQSKARVVARFDYLGDEGTISRALVYTGRTIVIADKSPMEPVETACIQVQVCDEPRLTVKDGAVRVECKSVQVF
jgi:hypothetical protein